ncbi:MAG: pilin [Candidatus Falkowbacteria bacterium]|nr:pilin [Candidatus Falkowbacteria bacterium]
MFKAKTLLLSVLITGFAFSPALVSANTWTNRIEEGGLNVIGSQAFGESGAPQKSIYSIIARVIKVMLGLLGTVFVVLLILAGFKYMTSAGDEEKIKEAVGQIRNAIIGLLIVVVAYSITYYVTLKAIPTIMK